MLEQTIFAAGVIVGFLVFLGLDWIREKRRRQPVRNAVMFGAGRSRDSADDQGGRSHFAEAPP